MLKHNIVEMREILTGPRLADDRDQPGPPLFKPESVKAVK